MVEYLLYKLLSGGRGVAIMNYEEGWEMGATLQHRIFRSMFLLSLTFLLIHFCNMSLLLHEFTLNFCHLIAFLIIMYFFFKLEKTVSNI